MSESNGGNARLDRIEKLIEKSERRIEKSERRIEKSQRRNEEAHARFDRDLRRWAALGVQEARSQRKRAREIDENITRLAAAQLITEEGLQDLKAAQKVTEELFQRFIKSTGRGRNGHLK